MPRLLRVLLVLALSGSCLGGSSILYLRVHRAAIAERLRSAPLTVDQELGTLRAQFEAAGCTPDNLYEQKFSKDDTPNLICTVPGSEPGNIIVGAPLEASSDAAQPSTHWATLALLPLLAESVASVRHRHSLTFVAFGGQHHGFHGSSEYLKQMAKASRAHIIAMLSLDDIGRTPPVYALGQNNLSLANWLTLSSSTLRLHFIPIEITPDSVDAPVLNGRTTFQLDDYLVDARSFQHSHVPVIAVRSAPTPMIPSLRRAGMWQGNSSSNLLDLTIYDQTYNLLAVYLIYLDSNLGTPHATPRSSQTAVVASSAPEVKKPADSAPAPAALSAPPKTEVASASVPASSGSPSAAEKELPEQPLPVATFKAESKLVLMDVTVTDSHGVPMKGLQASNFTLLENGKPQTIKVFEAHVAEPSHEPVAQTSLPPGTFTNRISAGDTQLNILLFDMLNTPAQDQAYARDQMLRCLRSLSKGKYLTLFILGTHLQMLQTSTDDPEKLAKSVEKLVRQNSPLLTTEAQQQQDQGFTEEIGRHAAPTLPPQAAASASPSARNDATAWLGSVSQRTATSSRMEGIRSDERTTMTLEALGAIARAVSGFPGRKNLVWLSGSFKIRIRPSDNTLLGVAARTTAAASAVSDQSSTFSYQEAIRQLSIQLATARIAVYPIDVRGLTAGGVNIAVSAESSESMVNPANNDNYTNTLNGQAETRYSEHNSMHDLAEQTGGHAFFNNDVQGSIARSLDDGSTYYTLAYAPEKGQDDKSFRRVEIKLNLPAVLAYRPGYYPNRSQESFAQSGAHLLAAAMQPGLPQSTMVPVTLRVAPPDANNKSVRLDYTIDLSAVEFVDTADNRKRALIDCMAVALDANGNIAAQTANTMDVTLGAKELAEYQRTGLPAHQELALPAGNYDLRVGVLDRGSQRIGTIDTSLLVRLENAAKN